MICFCLDYGNYTENVLNWESNSIWNEDVESDQYTKNNCGCLNWMDIDIGKYTLFKEGI